MGFPILGNKFISKVQHNAEFGWEKNEGRGTKHKFVIYTDILKFIIAAWRNLSYIYWLFSVFSLYSVFSMGCYKRPRCQKWHLNKLLDLEKKSSKIWASFLICLFYYCSSMAISKVSRCILNLIRDKIQRKPIKLIILLF